MNSMPAALTMLQMTCVASCARFHGNITEASPILTSSALAAFEGVRGPTVLVDELDAGGLLAS